MSKEYKLHATFNVSDLIPFVGSTNDEEWNSNEFNRARLLSSWVKL